MNSFYKSKIGSSNWVLKVLIFLIVAFSCNQFSEPLASATSLTACQKISVKIVNADKVYVALQLGVVKAAQDYIGDSSLSNRLLYNDSYIYAIRAANTELNFAIKSPRCYSKASIAQYKASIKTNLKEITGIESANINGQVVGDPKKMSSYKPVGLLN